jgi:hypothetical protein
MAKEEVEETLTTASFLGSFEIKIITGNSKAMRNIVIEVCDKYSFNYYIPSDNLGIVMVNHVNL